MSPTGVIVLAHGSRGEREPGDRLRQIVQYLRLRVTPPIEIEHASLQFGRPRLSEAIEILMGRGVRHVVVVPYFLFEGRHINQDIPQELDAIRMRYPDIEVSLAETLGVDDRLVDVLVDRVSEAIRPLAIDGSVLGRHHPQPNMIEAQSMTIIDRLLPPLSCSMGERDVIKRVVHATGDPQIARQIRIHPDAIQVGIAAIGKKAPIFTDVKMVAAGISRRATELGCEVICMVNDKDVASLAKENGKTRAATAIDRYGDRLDGAIVAIGNAPTALYALLELIDLRVVLPALVVGVPVGFVGAAQSKAELAKHQVPYILTEGFRGGSGVAAAAVNALLKLAEEDEELAKMGVHI